MSLVTYLVRAQLRRRWRVWLGLVALIAIGGGTSIFAISAWQRTSTAMDRFLEDFHPGNAVAVGSGFDRDALVAQPAILDADSGEYFFLVPNDASGPDTTRLGDVNPFSSAHGRMLHGMSDARVIEGRTPDPDEELEIGVDEELAAAYGVGPGDTLRLTGITPEQFEATDDLSSIVPDGPTFDFTVTGVLRRPSDVVPAPGAAADVLHLGTRDLVLTPAFHAAHYRQDVAGGSYFDPPGIEFMELRVAPGTTEDELRAQVAEAAPDAQVFQDPSEDAVAAAVSDRAIGLQAAAVLAVGIVVAVVSILFLVLGLSRVLGDQAREAGPLLAAGLSAGTLRAVTLITAAAIAVVGAIGAIAISVALSPLSPVGLARRAEPDPGLHVDPAVTFVGALVTVVVALVIALGVAARHRHVLARPRRARRPALPARLAAQTSDVAVATGLRFAGRRTGSRAATQLTVGLACLAVIASLTFATSAAATVREPERYGWGWALSVGNPNDGVLYERLVEELPDHPAVGAATAVHSGCGGSLDHGDDHAEAPLIATEPLEGSIQPQVQSGRLPNGPGEVALGAVTARQLGAEAGDVIQVGSGDCDEGQQPLTVTGIAVFNEALLATRIGEGALVDVAALEPLGVTPFQGVVLVDPPEGMSAAEAREALRADYGRVVAGPIVPGDLDALDRVRSLPSSSPPSSRSWRSARSGSPSAAGCVAAAATSPC